jgi:antitoxin HigA-1
MQIIPFDAIHPGEILKEDFLQEYGISATKAAADIGVPPSRIERVISGDDAIAADIALRLGRYFGNSPEFWLNLQRSYDLSIAREATSDLQNIKPVQAA